MDGQESVGSGVPRQQAFDEALRLMRTAIDAGSSAWAASASPAAGQGFSGDARKDVELIAQASIAMMMSSLRSGLRMAEIWARLGPALLSGWQDGEGEAGPDRRGILIDEMRACLREIAEVPADEARLLQAELERLFDAIRPMAAGERSGPYRRRWKAKP